MQLNELESIDHWHCVSFGLTMTVHGYDYDLKLYFPAHPWYAKAFGWGAWPEIVRLSGNWLAARSWKLDSAHPAVTARTPLTHYTPNLAKRMISPWQKHQTPLLQVRHGATLTASFHTAAQWSCLLYHSFVTKQSEPPAKLRAVSNSHFPSGSQTLFIFHSNGLPKKFKVQELRI